MKKIVICCILIGVFLIVVMGATFQQMSGGFLAILSGSQSTDDEEIGTCVYKSSDVTFTYDTEEMRSKFDDKVDPYLMNVALAMFENDKTLIADDIIKEINTWDTSKGVDFNLQNYKYNHEYATWLISINEKHSLSSSRKYFKEVYQGTEKDAYMYYLKVMNYINEDCKAIVSNLEWNTPLEMPYNITQDYWKQSVAGGIHRGVDLTKSYGADVYAVITARVAETNNTCAPDGGYLGNMCGNQQGNYVVLEVKDNETIFYVITMHMKDVIVKVNDVVTVGQKIGTQGHSGNSTGSHVHIEFRTTKGLPSSLSQYINPHNYINFYSGT